jgi:hypothetical protein
VNINDRTAALEKTLRKYRGKPFKWGETDCVKMARSHLRLMGHKPPPIPRYYSAIGARRALAETGCDTLAELLDLYLPRIAPAAMLPGDLAMLPGEPPFDAVVIALPGGKVACWRDPAPTLVNLVVDGNDYLAAWRL